MGKIMRKQRITVGLALGGGGARGLAHLGVLKALEEARIPLGAIAGTSMGAAVGGAYAQMPDSTRLIRIIHDLIDQFDMKSGWMGFLCQEGEKDKAKRENLLKELSDFVRRKLIYVVGASRVSLEHQDKLMLPLKTALLDEPIEKAQIPFAAVAVDLVSGKEVTIKSGSMIDAVYASSSVEGVFPPLYTDNQVLSDGGVTSLVPVDAARELGANFVIGVSIPQFVRPEKKFRSGIEIILRADALTREKLNRLMLEKCDVVITPQVQAIHWANFGKLDECIQKGYDAVADRMDEIKEKMKKRNRLWNRIRKNLGQVITGKT
jgi:NTE family protein